MIKTILRNATLAALVLGMVLYTVEAEAGSGGVAGSGKGTITCPNYATKSGVNIGFSATKLSGEVSGKFSIFAFQSGILNDGWIGSTWFHLKGTVTKSSSCGGEAITVPTTIEIKGKCGANVEITISEGNGLKGTFRGSALCT